MSDYIKREDAIKSIKPMVGIWADDGRFYVDYQRVLDIINNEPSADVVEVGLITCFGIKFVMEDDMIKVKWRHGDKHYLVPFGGLLELWEKYEEQKHE